MRHLVFITGAEDPNVRAVARYLPASVCTTVLTLEAMVRDGYVLTADSTGSDWRLESGAARFSQRDSEQYRVWLLFPNVFYYQSGMKEPHENEFCRMELAAFFDSLYQVFGSAWWLNSPASIRRAESRLGQLREASRCGLRVPDWIVTNDAKIARSFWEGHRQQVVIKRLGNRRVYLPVGHEILTSRLSLQDLETREFLRGVSFLQEEVVCRHEIRVTIVGRELFACRWERSFAHEGIVDYRAAGAKLQYEQTELPADVRNKLLKLMDYYGLNYAGVDLLHEPPDRYVFLELNANGQYLWIEEAVGLPISQALGTLIAGSAFEPN